jgi:hypothetical protein
VALDRATDTGEVAGVEGLQHQDERVALPPPDRVDDLVLDVVRHDVDRESHSAHSLGGRAATGGDVLPAAAAADGVRADCRYNDRAQSGKYVAYR